MIFSGISFQIIAHLISYVLIIPGKQKSELAVCNSLGGIIPFFFGKGDTRLVSQLLEVFHPLRAHSNLCFMKEIKSLPSAIRTKSFKSVNTMSCNKTTNRRGTNPLHPLDSPKGEQSRSNYSYWLCLD